MCSIQACREDDDENTELIDNTGETNNTDEMDYSLLIGMWQLEGTEDLNITHFKSDGTAITYYGENGHIQETYTYTLNGNQLKMEGVNNVNTRILNIRHLTSSELVLCYTPFSVELTNRYKRYYGELPNTGNNNDGVTSINSPTNVQAYENDGKVTITWSSVSGASTYSVWRSSSSNGSYSPLVYSTSGTTHTDYYPNTGYNYYKVKALGGQHIESDFSSYASVYVEKKEETPIVQKPNAPTGVTVSNEGNNYYPDVVIRWNEVSGADKYYVYRSSSANGSYSKIATVQWNAYTDNTAPTSQASYYKVKAVNSAGESPYSSYAKYTPADNSGGSGGNEEENGGSGTKTKLDAPTNLDYASDLYYVQISFDEVPLAYQYELYRSNSAYSGYTKITASGGSISGGRYVLTDSNPKSGTAYYKVKAKALSYLGIQDSDYSSYIKVTR